MADYPQTVLEFNERFHDDAACRAYLESIRWPEGSRCPRCPQAKVWTMKAPFYRCASCAHDFTVTAGTLFADTHLPLRLWFQAMWYVVNQKNGASALGVQRVLGLGSYRTAWRWLHKLRRAMVRPGRDRLAGTVEVDELYVGGERPGKRGRGAAGKALVLIAAQVDGSRIGRIRLARVANASAPVLSQATAAAVSPGSQVLSDGWNGYAQSQRLPAFGGAGQRRGRSQSAAAGQSGGVAVAAVAAGHASGSSGGGAFGLLFGRVHVSVQPANLWLARAIVPTTGRTGAGFESGARRRVGRRYTAPRNGGRGIKCIALKIILIDMKNMSFHRWWNRL